MAPLSSFARGDFVRIMRPDARGRSVVRGYGVFVRHVKPQNMTDTAVVVIDGEEKWVYMCDLELVDLISFLGSLT